MLLSSVGCEWIEPMAPRRDPFVAAVAHLWQFPGQATATRQPRFEREHEMIFTNTKRRSALVESAVIRCRRIVVAAIAVAGALALMAGVAWGAAPTGNGLYSGTVSAHGYLMKVEVHVAPSGKTASARFYCNGTTIASNPQDNAKFAITKGSFSGLTKFGIYGIKGKFVSATNASATLHVEGTCSTAASANYKVTLRLSGH